MFTLIIFTSVFIDDKYVKEFCRIDVYLQISQELTCYLVSQAIELYHYYTMNIMFHAIPE